MTDPYQSVRDFENALCERTGARFAVSASTCTNALLLCCAYLQVGEVTIPKHTYIGVAQSILNAGGRISFDDRDWIGGYQLKPYPIFDCARRFTENMFVPQSFVCISFNTTKIVKHPDGGGAILLDDESAYEKLKKMRFDGRTEGVAVKDDKPVRGYRCNIKPSHASGLLLALRDTPRANADLPNDKYPDLSKFTIFSGGSA